MLVFSVRFTCCWRTLFLLSLRINEDYCIYSLVKIATAYYADDCFCSLIRSNISDILMPRKCCAYTCRANYDSEKINTEDSGKKLQYLCIACLLILKKEENGYKQC